MPERQAQLDAFIAKYLPEREPGPELNGSSKKAVDLVFDGEDDATKGTKYDRARTRN